MYLNKKKLIKKNNEQNQFLKQKQKKQGKSDCQIASHVQLMQTSAFYAVPGPADQQTSRQAVLGDVKAGVHLKAVFWLGIMFLMQISRLRFKQSRICSLITHIYVLRRFVNFLVIFRFIWRQIVFLKGLVKFMEIGNFEDLVLF